MKKIIPFILSFVCFGCNDPWGTDVCIEERVFNQCMEKIPASPRTLTASGNDLDETIEACRGAASQIATRRRAAIPTECH